MATFPIKLELFQCADNNSSTTYVNDASTHAIFAAKAVSGCTFNDGENFYISRAAECGIDSAGRILIPAYLRAYAALEKEITFTSSIHGFRIWDARVWTSVFQAAEEALIENPDEFAEVDL